MTDHQQEVERVSVAEAAARLARGATYVDVRTAEEFVGGRPDGAVNVPLLVREAGRMVESASFLDQVRERFATNSALVVGCATGKRSLVAARRLIAAGFTDVVEMRAGFDGIKDPFGQVVEKGWAAEGRPVAYGEGAGAGDAASRS